ncbi:MAG: aminopeptidase P family protein [Desulfobulbaceae bacterium]|uniref:Aminopeptidase P family protein n=1 Tax=Candidatus Desulfatifera sulfidica TaxID=2841691 RepID=A0A8J6NAM1_9BACT|nr:aminopeptidase P family protein [Candidatus Desulfatifera sulfidica]
MNYKQRIRAIQARLRRNQIDALLVSQPENRRYLCGYSASDHSINESSGFLLIHARQDPWLLTDFRFQQQAEAEAKDCRVEPYPKGLLKLLNQLLPDLGIRSLAFESHYTLHDTTQKLAIMAEKLAINLRPLSGWIEALRLIKDKDEIDRIRAAVILNEQIFQHVHQTIQPGQTEIEVALALENRMRTQGAEGPSFETIVASGPNSALPHAVPGVTAIQANQPLMIDMGLILDGYCSDMTRTFVAGVTDVKYLKIHRLVRKAQLAAQAEIRAGIPAAKVDHIARKIITDGGYGDAFGHALGHGVGLAVHEDPRLSARNRSHLKAGMVITVEPGIYLPGWGGVRLENMVVVSEDGCEILNQDHTGLDL